LVVQWIRVEPEGFEHYLCRLEGGFAGPAYSFAMSPDQVRVGVIGRGFGARVVAPAFDQTDGCKVLDVVSPRDEAAGVALCARDDVDLISVHSPPFLHLEHVRQAIEGGHAVLCDKPFGRNGEEAAAMCALADEAGVVNLLNFELRFDPFSRRLHDLVQDGAIGEAEHVQCTTHIAVSRLPLRRFGWLFDAKLGGGWIGAWGSHFIDFLRWSIGGITGASATPRITIAERPDAEGRMHRCTAEDGFTATLKSANGVTISIDSTFAAPANVPTRLTVIGQDGVLELTGNQRIIRYDAEGAHDELNPDQSGDPMLQMRQWTAVVRDAVRGQGSEPGTPTFADGLACARVMDRLRS
jgi:predicted dehydrogenase